MTELDARHYEAVAPAIARAAHRLKGELAMERQEPEFGALAGEVAPS